MNLHFLQQLPPSFARIFCLHSHGLLYYMFFIIKSVAPIYVTKNGYNDMVIMSAEVYDRICLVSVYEKLMEAEVDIEEGSVMA